MKKLLRLTLVVMAVFATTISWAYTTKNVDFHGFFSQGYLATSHNSFLGQSQKGTFDYTEAAFNASTALNDKTRIGAQIFTSRRGTIGSLREPEIDWAYIDYQWHDWMGFRLGKVKIPFGLYTESIDLDMARPYAFLPMSGYRASWRDFMGGIYGLELYGNLPARKYGSFDYNLVGGKIHMAASTGVVRGQEQSGPIWISDVDQNYTVVGQLIWNTPTPGLRLVGSALYIQNFKMIGKFKNAADLSALPPPVRNLSAYSATFAGKRAVASFDNVSNIGLGVEYLWKEWSFMSEYGQVNALSRLAIDDPAATDPAISGERPSRVANEYFYIGASRRMSKKLELGGYYSVYFANKDDRSGDQIVSAGNVRARAYQKDLTLVASYHVKPWWILKLEGHAIDGTALLDNLSANGGYQNMNNHWLLGVFKSTMYF